MNDISNPQTHWPPLDVEGRIAFDVPCIACGYNLRSMMLDGACPECGMRVEQSTKQGLLRFCAPMWVNQIARGALWVIAGIIVIGLYAGVFQANIWRLPTFAVLILLAAEVAYIRGWWLITTPEPHRRKRDGLLSYRRLIRFMVVASPLLFLAQHFVDVQLKIIPAKLENLFTAVQFVIQACCSLTGVNSAGHHLSGLAKQIPDAVLARGVYEISRGLFVSLIGLFAVCAISMVFSPEPIGEISGLFCLAAIGFIATSVFATLWFGLFILLAARLHREAQAAHMNASAAATTNSDSAVNK